MFRLIVMAVVLVALSAGDVVARTKFKVSSSATSQYSLSEQSGITLRKNGKRDWWEENQTYSTRFRAEQLGWSDSVLWVWASDRLCAE